MANRATAAAAVSRPPKSQRSDCHKPDYARVVAAAAAPRDDEALAGKASCRPSRSTVSARRREARRHGRPVCRS